MIDRYTLLLGDCLDVLPTLEAGSVQCVVTSPPYWGLRDYGVDGQLGLEQTPDEYVSNMVAVFRAVRQVLRDDGTVWLNLGDSYAANRGSGASGIGVKQATNVGANLGKLTVPMGLKEKDLVGIPWRVAFALQADGWWLRSDIIWHKPNPMPESVTDRPTKAHEYVFLLTKQERYFYDAEAVKEASVDPSGSAARYKYEFGGPAKQAIGKFGATKPEGKQEFKATRNRRTVWTIATQPYSGTHFATMPPALAEVCVKAGTSERGCCPACGAPWEGVVERTRDWRDTAYDDKGKQTYGLGSGNRMVKPSNGGMSTSEYQTTGWQPTCDCDAGEPVGCVVLDPFMGSGTTGQVAAHLGRRFIGIELSAEYLELARQRVGNPYGDFVLTDKERSSGQLPLFGQADD